MYQRKNSNRFLIVLFVVASVWFSACGGGTSGTGTGSSVQNYAGILIASDGSPIKDASITLTETGDSAVTKEDGTFLIESESGLQSATFLVETSSTSTTITLDDLQADASSITIAIDETKASQNISKAYDIRVKIVGVCDQYFENTRPIRQSNPIPKGTSCTLKVSINGASGGLPNRTFQLQSNNCKQSNIWKDIARGQTSAKGVAQTQFQFTDSESSCIYRVLTPLNDKNISPLAFEILTSTFQIKNK